MSVICFGIVVVLFVCGFVFGGRVGGAADEGKRRQKCEMGIRQGSCPSNAIETPPGCPASTHNRAQPRGDRVLEYVLVDAIEEAQQTTLESWWQSAGAVSNAVTLAPTGTCTR
jgi:hypothetical protein